MRNKVVEEQFVEIERAQEALRRSIEETNDLAARAELLIGSLRKEPPQSGKPS